jgi:phage gpG-like protein
MIEINFELEGQVEMSRRLRTLDTKTRDFSKEFKQSGEFLRNFFGSEVFDTQGRAIGEPWKLRKREYPWPILQNTGRMKGGFKSQAWPLKAEIWNVVDYFKYHQSRTPRIKMPRRVMMKLVEQLKNKIVKFIQAGVIKRIKESK